MSRYKITRQVRLGYNRGVQGYKTYIVCAVAVIYAITGFFSGNLDTNAAIQVGLAALGAAGLRHGLANS